MKTKSKQVKKQKYILNEVALEEVSGGKYIILKKRVLNFWCSVINGPTLAPHKLFMES
jgi:hypothetical protein